MTDQKKYNVGVIGYGLSAKVFHIPLILTTPSFNLHSIVQRTPVPGNSAGEDHPTIKVLPSTDALFAESDVDIVVVTTTPDSHFALTKAALEAGKHVIVEKPFVPTAQEADALIAIASAHQKLICVYQNRRWDSDFLTFRKLHAEGTLGRIVEYETHFDRYKPDRPDSWKGQLGMENAGGVIYDLGSHLLDQAYVVFGLPKAVTGIFQNQRADGSAEPDSITVLLHYGAEGPLVTAKAGVISIESEQLRFWIRGTKGSYHKNHLDVQEDQLKGGLRPGDAGFGIEAVESAGTLVTFVDEKPVSRRWENVVPETYGALYRGFAEAVAGGGEAAVPVKAVEARDVLRIIEAARESAKTGRTVGL